ncbi:SDR family NAD(P)-dependent oxidoreductase [Salinicoccus carnicancri]|uniref:SDR family NAD(P)-dependent oxidoreductase n=1 Tax=Salinicoccus carnicancri TaxID=558170 RepID=UPI00031460E2|nr:SDR family NAD(P)-dependent oxidoreductase [Salinicoccus carnicancri]
MSNRFEGQVVIITGGSGGIGKQTALQFLQEGAKVTIVDINEESLTSAREELSRQGEVLAVQADVSDEADVENYIRATVEKFGKVDVLFNNAGIIGKVGSLVDQEYDNFKAVTGVNMNGVFLGLKHAIKQMIKQGTPGSIINTGSVDSFRGSPEQSAYSATKHAVVGLTKTAAVEAAGHNIRVNSIHPAPVDTPMMAHVEESRDKKNSASVREKFTSGIPLNRYADSSDIADLVLFLASDDSKFVTGSQYSIDGGMMA